MKFQSSLVLGLSAFKIGRTLAQTCPAGYTPSISYITVTYTPTPSSSSLTADVTPTNGVCPAGYSPVVSYITVTASAKETSSAPEPTTTIYSSSTITATVTVQAGAASSAAAAVDSAVSSASASPVNAVENVKSKSASSSAAAATPTVAASSTVAPASTSAASTSAAAAVASSAASSSSSSSALSASLSGEATTYGGNVAGGACSFSTYTLPSSLFGTALSDSNWADSALCGACISVTGPSGNSITAMIVDECPGCGSNHLDLFPTAFTSLAPIEKGIIDVSWEVVPCGITSPIQLHNKSGVSAYWFSMQVVNSNEPISKLEVSADGGSTWLSTTRQTYNFFEISSGTGTTSVDVKITSSTGKTITINNVAVTDSSITTGTSNF